MAQPGTVLWEILTKLFVWSYFQQNKVLIFFSHFCDINHSSRVSYVHICEGWPSTFKIRWNARGLFRFLSSTLEFYTRHCCQTTFFKAWSSNYTSINNNNTIINHIWRSRFHTSINCLPVFLWQLNTDTRR
jgi:hypothetical protein